MGIPKFLSSNRHPFGTTGINICSHPLNNPRISMQADEFQSRNHGFQHVSRHCGEILSMLFMGVT